MGLNIRFFSRAHPGLLFIFSQHSTRINDLFIKPRRLSRSLYSNRPTLLNSGLRRLRIHGILLIILVIPSADIHMPIKVAIHDGLPIKIAPAERIV